MPPTLLPILQGAALLTEIAFGRGDSGNGKPRAADDEFKFAEQLSNALSASAQNSPAFAQIHREARVESRREIEERTARNDDFTKPREDSRRLDDDRSASDSRQSRRGEGPEGRDMTRVSEKTSSRHEGATTPKDISRQGRVGSHAATSHSAESSYARSTEGAPYAQNHSTAAAQLHQGELSRYRLDKGGIAEDFVIKLLANLDPVRPRENHEQFLPLRLGFGQPARIVPVPDSYSTSGERERGKDRREEEKEQSG